MFLCFLFHIYFDITYYTQQRTKAFFSFLVHTDLLPSDSQAPTLHLVAYSVNQKGRSEAFVLEDIAINEAEKRTGMFPFLFFFFFLLIIYFFVCILCTFALQ